MEGQYKISSDILPARSTRGERASRSADRAYQTVTIAAVLIMLGSLWVF